MQLYGAQVCGAIEWERPEKWTERGTLRMVPAPDRSVGTHVSRGWALEPCIERKARMVAACRARCIVLILCIAVALQPNGTGSLSCKRARDYTSFYVYDAVSVARVDIATTVGVPALGRVKLLNPPLLAFACDRGEGVMVSVRFIYHPITLTVTAISPNHIRPRRDFW